MFHLPVTRWQLDIPIYNLSIGMCLAESQRRGEHPFMMGMNPLDEWCFID